MDEKKREIDEKTRIIVTKADQETKEAKEAFLLKKSEILKEKEELTIEAKLFEIAEKEKLKTRLGEYDIKYALEYDRAQMKNEMEQ